LGAGSSVWGRADFDKSRMTARKSGSGDWSELVMAVRRYPYFFVRVSGLSHVICFETKKWKKTEQAGGNRAVACSGFLRPNPFAILIIS
jgi:hypothetical protein